MIIRKVQMCMGWLFSKHAYRRFCIQRTFKLEITSEFSMTVINFSLALTGRGLSIEWPRKYQSEITLNSSWALIRSPKLRNPAREMTQPPERWCCSSSVICGFQNHESVCHSWESEPGQSPEGDPFLAITQSRTGYPVNQCLVLP